MGRFLNEATARFSGSSSGQGCFWRLHDISNTRPRFLQMIALLMLEVRQDPNMGLLDLIFT